MAKPPNFSPALAATCDADPSSTAVLNRSLCVVYVNPAWFKFAHENAGHTVATQWAVGSAYLDAITQPLRGFYASAFMNVLDSGNTWQHLYECSSPGVERRFQMLVRPLADGLLISHALLESGPHTGAALPPLLQRYTGPTGMVVQCAHCRRTRRATTNTWDWVPAFLESPPAVLSHGLCQPCLDYHFPE